MPKVFWRRVVRRGRRPENSGVRDTLIKPGCPVSEWALSGHSNLCYISYSLNLQKVQLNFDSP